MRGMVREGERGGAGRAGGAGGRGRAGGGGESEAKDRDYKALTLSDCDQEKEVSVKATGALEVVAEVVFGGVWRMELLKSRRGSVRRRGPIGLIAKPRLPGSDGSSPHAAPSSSPIQPIISLHLI